MTLVREGSEWVARSASPADGDLELHLHEVPSSDPFQILVAGTLRGTSIDKNTDLGALPPWTMSFVGTDGLSVAQISGKHAPSIELSFGVESFVGTATMKDGRGNTAVCTSLWEWSIEPGK
jgi:hypothetical protein